MRGTWREADIPDLAGKRALVTGAASGIGFEAARALASHGAEVWIVDRNRQAGAAAMERIKAITATARLEFHGLDLSDLDAVRAFALARHREGRAIDILLNNAGIQPISERRTNGDGFELAFAIGHLGHFALTGLLMPLLEKAASARVVTVSSLVHGSGRIDWDDPHMTTGYRAQRAYNQTKLANLLFARELHRRLEMSGSRVRSIAAHPGVAQTSIGANRRQLGKFHAADHLVSAMLSLVMPYLGQPAAAGALPLLFAATSSDAVGGGFYGPNGLGEMRGWPGPARVKRAGRDMAQAHRLWQLSEEVTETKFRLPG